MINSGNNRRMVKELGAINSAEHYLIARTHREIRTGRAVAGQSQGTIPIMLATSATCMILTFVLAQAWPYIAVSTST